MLHGFKNKKTKYEMMVEVDFKGLVDKNARRNRFMKPDKWEANRKFVFLQTSYTQHYKANYYR